MTAIIITLLICIATFLIYLKCIKKKDPEAYIKINFVDFSTNNFYDTFSLYFDKNVLFKRRKIKEKNIITNVSGFRNRDILDGKLIIINSINNKKKEFIIKIYNKKTNVINININNTNDLFSSADIIFYSNDVQKQIKLNYYLEYNNYNTKKRKRLLIYNCDKQDIIKIINENSNDTILNDKAKNEIENNMNKLLLINFYISVQKTNILIFIEEEKPEKPLIIPTKEEKKFFTNFYVNIYNKQYENNNIIKKICEEYKNSLIKGQTIFGKKITNLDEVKNLNIYLSFINQGFNCLLENNIISKYNESDYYFILGYILLYAYFTEKNNYKNYLCNFWMNIKNAWKKHYSYIDLMKIGVSFTMFWTYKLQNLIFQYVDENIQDCKYNKGFEFFKSIINDLNEDSDLTFIYLQIHSGSGLNLINNEPCYKMSMLSVEDIKSHIIENVPKYYFIYFSKKNNYISTDQRTQVMCFNEEKLFDSTSVNSVKNNIMNITLGIFHEYGHAKFVKNDEVGADPSPKYCINKSFDLVEKLKWNNKDRGESGKFVDYFLYNSSDDAHIIIISSKRSNELMDKNLFTNNLDNLNVAAEDIIRKNSNINAPVNNSNAGGLNNLPNLSPGLEMEIQDDIERYKFLEKIGSDICY